MRISQFSHEIATAEIATHYIPQCPMGQPPPPPDTKSYLKIYINNIVFKAPTFALQRLASPLKGQAYLRTFLFPPFLVGLIPGVLVLAVPGRPPSLPLQ